MRARWLYAAAAALGILALFAQRSPGVGLEPASSPAVELGAAVVAPSSTPPATSARPISARYRVVDVSLPPLLAEVLGEWAGSEANGALIDWNADVVTIVTPTRHIEGRVALAPQRDGSERGTITLTDGRALPIVVRSEGTRTSVELVAAGDAADNVFAGGSLVMQR